MSTIKKLLSKVLSFFKPDYQSDLETYILSKNPKTSIDVEYWTIMYNRKLLKGGI